jgi:hypothetical protein
VFWAVDAKGFRLHPRGGLTLLNGSWEQDVVFQMYVPMQVFLQRLKALVQVVEGWAGVIWQ